VTGVHCKRWVLSAAAAGFAAPLLLAASPAAACTSTPTTLGAGATGAAAQAAPVGSAIASTGSGASLPFTGAPVVDLLLVAGLLLGAGWLLLSMTGDRNTPKRMRLAVAACIVVSTVAGLASPATATSPAIPSAAAAPLAQAACTPALTPSVNGIETGPLPDTSPLPGSPITTLPQPSVTSATPSSPGAPPPVLPEVPLPVLLPLGALVVIGCAGIRRRPAAGSTGSPPQ
jgi:hypothetical protein